MAATRAPTVTEEPAGFLYVPSFLNEVDEKGLAVASEAMAFSGIPHAEPGGQANRSACVLGGAALWSWQHSIPATAGLPYSVTFRTLSGRGRTEIAGPPP